MNQQKVLLSQLMHCKGQCFVYISNRKLLIFCFCAPVFPNISYHWALNGTAIWWNHLDYALLGAVLLKSYLRDSACFVPWPSLEWMNTKHFGYCKSLQEALLCDSFWDLSPFGKRLPLGLILYFTSLYWGLFTASWNCWKYFLWLLQGFSWVCRGTRESCFQNYWYNLTGM